MNKPIYVAYWAEIFKMTPTKWKKYLKALANDQNPDIRDYGRYVNILISHDATNLTADDAKYELEGIALDETH